MPVQQPVLRAHGLSKRYGSHLALDDVSLDFHPGQVHALFGENGAGKSTLIAMLAGAHEPSAGHLEIGAHRGCFRSVAQARAAGVRAVFQEFSLVPQLTVAQNIVLGEEPMKGPWLDQRAALAQARALIAELGFDLDAAARVATLARGKQQMVEICKALRSRPKVLILDEPTASLSEHDARSLFGLVRRLQADGTAIVYITHRMHEIGALADAVSVLRDGRLMATVPAHTPPARLIELMTGRALAHVYPPPGAATGPVRLALRGVDLQPRRGMVNVRGIDLEVRGGEIVGIAGLVGCGKSELAQACFGLVPLAAGRIEVDGRALQLDHPSQAIAAGLWYSPADRKHEGLALARPARENIALSGLAHGFSRGRWLRPARERASLRSACARVQFASERLGEPVQRFSGGNQQKVLLAKGLVQPVGVFVLDEPTVGVDVGARLAIYQCLAELSAAGAAIVVVSSDLPELMGLAHRLHVMNNGVLSEAIVRADFEEQRILERFFR